MDWAGVGAMLVVSLVLAVILVPAARFLLPTRLREIGTAYAVVAVLLPLGLIAPGFAFGEGSADDVQREFGYVPSGLRALGDIFSAPLKDYTLPLPFFSAEDAPMWHAAIGYEVAGVVGIMLLGAVTLGLTALLRRGSVDDPAPVGRTTA